MELKTIQIGVELKNRLDARKIHSRESYNEVISKLIERTPEYDNESMMETIEVLSDPEALKDIAKALKEFEKGEYVEL